MLASGHSVAELPLFLAVGAGHEQKKRPVQQLAGPAGRTVCGGLRAPGLVGHSASLRRFQSENDVQNCRECMFSNACSCHHDAKQILCVCATFPAVPAVLPQQRLGVQRITLLCMVVT